MKIKVIFKNIFYIGIIINVLLGTNSKVYKTNYTNSDYHLLRRVREAETKEELAINYFIEELRTKFGTGLLETYLIPKELREEEDRIDIVIVYDGIEEDELLDVATGISYYIAGVYDEVIVPIALSKEEYENILNKFSILNKFFGPITYQNPDERDVSNDIKGHYNIGIDFLDVAKIWLKENKFYPTFVNTFFASERFIATIILNSGQKDLAKSHGGLLRQFKNVPGVKDEWQRTMDELLGKRISYFYRGTEVTDKLIKDVNILINLAQELKKYIQTNILN